MEAFEKIKNSSMKKAIAMAALLNEPGLILKPESREFSRDDYEALKMRCIENPLGLIRQINNVISIIANPQQRLQFCLEAAALEAIVERDYVSTFDFLPERTDGKETRIERGIPNYIYDGFVDMGYYREETGRTREKLLADKLKLKEKLGHAKFMAMEYPDKAPFVLARMTNDAFRYSLEAVNEIGKEHGFGPVGLDAYVDKSTGLCRQAGLLYQMFAQESGSESRIVKGMLNVLHVWNTVKGDNKALLVDAAQTYMKRTERGYTQRIIIMQARSLEECYNGARKEGFRYKPHERSRNFFKYRKLEL